MTVVIGTAGHIDHGKTTLLRALTGIDADRLPEERRRGMTIDVGYAYMALPDGTELDFVDVPGHDRLVGNMLVGAGEIDAAMLVVAADDGPRAQTLEHLALLDALAVRHGLAVVTKADVAGPERTAEVVAEVGRLLGGTTLAASPVHAVSSVDGRGIEDLRGSLVALRDRVARAGTAAGSPGSSEPAPGSRLAIDRVFAVKGRGAVVTGTLRGRGLTRAGSLRLVPGGQPVRIREIQVHGAAVDRAGPGRTALNLAGVEPADLYRGIVVTDDPWVEASDRVLVRLRVALPDRSRARAHLGTAAAEASIGRSGRDAIDLPDGSAVAILRLSIPVAVAPGDRLVLRRSSGAERIVGATVLDIEPPRGISRRRQSAERVTRLADAVDSGDRGSIAAARLELHGAIAPAHGPVAIAVDVTEAVGPIVVASVEGVASLTAVRSTAARAVRRRITIGRQAAAAAAVGIVDDMVRHGGLVRDDSEIRLPGTVAAGAESDLDLAVAMDRLERALAVAAPPGLVEAARSVGCPPEGIRALERAARIEILEPDLAYAASTYRALASRALAMAALEPLTPAAFRDATGTSRKYVMAILTDLDRRGILRRTDAGHVPGPRAPSAGDR
jgi:selenocysteine-specific elongation factor